jgi:hypothetical protein
MQERRLWRIEYRLYMHCNHDSKSHFIYKKIQLRIVFFFELYCFFQNLFMVSASVFFLQKKTGEFQML